LKPTEAVEVLPHAGKRAAEPLVKAIKSAIANARQKGINDQDLEFKEIQIGEGPTFKRGRPVGKGRWHPYVRRMSHIRIVLESKEPEVIKKARKKISKTSSKDKSKKGEKHGTKS
jgi:large subunit ribosomal protein L22